MENSSTLPNQTSPQPVEGEDSLSNSGQKTVNKSKYVKILLLLTVVIILGGLGSYLYLKTQKTNNNQSVNLQPTKQTETSPNPSTAVIQSADVNWSSEPQKVQSVGFFTLVDKYYPYKLEYCKSGIDCSKLSEMTDKYEPKTTYYQVGTMKSQYGGSPVYLAITKGLPTTYFS